MCSNSLCGLSAFPETASGMTDSAVMQTMMDALLRVSELHNIGCIELTDSDHIQIKMAIARGEVLLGRQDG